MNIYYYSLPYTDSSNGLRLAYEFVLYLRKVGFKAFNLVETEHFEKNDYPVEYRDNICILNNFVLNSDDIVIYPETISGNPLKADKVIRFFLNRVDKNISYGESEYFVSYNSAIYPGFPVFYCQKDEVALFSSLRKEKQLSPGGKTLTFYFGKSRYAIMDKSCKVISDLGRDFANIRVITRKSPSNHLDTLKLVRDSDLFVSFDALTNLNYESTLLGTPVLMVDDYFKINNETEIGHYGFAFDVSQINNARECVGKAFEEYVSIIVNQGKNFSYIIEDSLKHFGKIKTDTEYANSYIEWAKLVIKSNPPCCFENINELADIPLRIRKRMHIDSSGIKIKVEIKYLFMKFKLYHLIKNIHKVFTKLCSNFVG